MIETEQYFVTIERGTSPQIQVKWQLRYLIQYLIFHFQYFFGIWPYAAEHKHVACYLD